MFKVGIFAIIFDLQKKVLLCHRRDHDLWNLPGGGLEKGESPWEGVIREVKEEVGLEVEVARLQGVYSKPQADEIVLSFICNKIGGKINLTDEADEIRYFKIEDIPTNTSPKQVERIKDAITENSVVLKIQTGPRTIDMVKLGKK